ncbi:MAG: hypothetical protein WAU96_12455 [Anaerolineae bacterium]
MNPLDWQPAEPSIVPAHVLTDAARHKTMCSKCGERPHKPGQRYCKACHAEYMRNHRAKDRKLMQEFRAFRTQKQPKSFTLNEM